MMAAVYLAHSSDVQAVVVEAVVAEIADAVAAEVVEIKNRDMSKIKTISIQGKVSDRCFTELFDEEDNSLLERDGYVPKWMPSGGGDYIRFEIDNATGKILNWVPIEDEVLENEK